MVEFRDPLKKAPGDVRDTDQQMEDTPSAVEVGISLQDASLPSNPEIPETDDKRGLLVRRRRGPDAMERRTVSDAMVDKAARQALVAVEKVAAALAEVKDALGKIEERVAFPADAVVTLKSATASAFTKIERAQRVSEAREERKRDKALNVVQSQVAVALKGLDPAILEKLAMKLAAGDIAEILLNEVRGVVSE